MDERERRCRSPGPVAGREPPAWRGVAVVTGASRGIGAATARLLAARGWAVCVGYRRAAERGRGSCGTMRPQVSRRSAVRVDVTSTDEIGGLFVAARALGPVTALVDNAGIVDRTARVGQMSEARLHRMFAVNVVGVFLCAAEAVRCMSTRHGGSGGAIVNVSSAAARLGSAGEYVDYAASKGAVDTMTLGLAREVAHEAIRVNAVRSGLIDTDIHSSGGHPDRIERLRHQIPMRRGGRPEEVAETIAWLCSPESSYVTGALVDVRGGR